MVPVRQQRKYWVRVITTDAKPKLNSWKTEEYLDDVDPYEDEK